MQVIASLIHSAARRAALLRLGSMKGDRAMDFDIRIGAVELQPRYVKLGAFFELWWEWGEHRYPWLWYDDRSGFQWGRLVVRWTLPREGRAFAARQEAKRAALRERLEAMAPEFEAEWAEYKASLAAENPV